MPEKKDLREGVHGAMKALGRSTQEQTGVRLRSNLSPTSVIY